MQAGIQISEITRLAVGEFQPQLAVAVAQGAPDFLREIVGIAPFAGALNGICQCCAGQLEVGIVVVEGARLCLDRQRKRSCADIAQHEFECGTLHFRHRRVLESAGHRKQLAKGYLAAWVVFERGDIVADGIISRLHDAVGKRGAHQHRNHRFVHRIRLRPSLRGHSPSIGLTGELAHDAHHVVHRARVHCQVNRNDCQQCQQQESKPFEGFAKHLASSAARCGR